MALVIVVVIQAQVGVLLLVGQRLEDGFLRSSYSRMIHLRLSGVFHKEHVRYQTHQSVANPQTVLVTTSVEGLCHLALRAIRLLQVVEVIGLAHQEVVAHIGGMDAKQTLNQSIVDEGLSIQFLTEWQTKILYLVNSQRQRGREMTQHAVNSIGRNLPDAEVAQYVVDAQGIKILRQVTETMFQHAEQRLIPMVCGEAPVGTSWPVGIGNCSRLRICIEEFRMLVHL